MLKNNNVVNDLENELNIENIEAVAYCRTKKNNDLMTVIALENQKNAIREYADKNNIKIVEWYIDDGYSGVNDKRPAFQRMFDDLNNKKYNECKNVKMLLVHKIDRFARNLEIFSRYYGYLQLCKVDLNIVNFNCLNTTEGKMMLQMLVAISEYYKNDDSEFNNNEGVQLWTPNPKS